MLEPNRASAPAPRRSAPASRRGTISTSGIHQTEQSRGNNSGEVRTILAPERNNRRPSDGIQTQINYRNSFPTVRSILKNTQTGSVDAPAEEIRSNVYAPQRNTRAPSDDTQMKQHRASNAAALRTILSPRRNTRAPSDDTQMQQHRASAFFKPKRVLSPQRKNTSPRRSTIAQIKSSSPRRSTIAPNVDNQGRRKTVSLTSEIDHSRQSKYFHTRRSTKVSHASDLLTSTNPSRRGSKKGVGFGLDDSRESAKKARFDEKNIELTYKVPGKDYGLMKITEPKTPFPRQWAPVDPVLLHKKLLAAQDNQTDGSDESIEIFDGPKMVYGSSTSSSASTNQAFEIKRKRLEKGEFTIAQQRPTNTMIHPAMPYYFMSYDNTSRMGIDQFQSFTQL